MKTKYPLGTTRVPKKRSTRLTSYLRGLGWLIAVVSLAIGILSLVQVAFHPFDALLGRAQSELGSLDDILQGDAFAGISFGTLALVILIAAIPLFQRGVRKAQYALSFWRGLLSSAIFLGTDRLYRYVQSLGQLYFSATVAIFIAATIVLIEIISRIGKASEEADTRTELIASIVSGLVFGLLVQFGERLLG
jgi:hypothetical protein